MSDLPRMLEQYEEAVRRLTDALTRSPEVRPDHKYHLRLLDRLLTATIQSYAAFHASEGPALDASTSVMYARATGAERGVLNVPLRSLVDAAMLTAWQARYLNGTLGMRRSLLVAGPAGSGKSTLVNSLIQLIPVDQRIVAVEEKQELPVLADRAFTVRLEAGGGTEDRRKTIRRAGAMHPNWLLLDEVRGDEALVFLEQLTPSTAGLAVLASEQPEATLEDWLSGEPGLGALLGKISPLVVSVTLDRAGRPRLVDLLDVAVENGSLALSPRRP